MMTKHTGILKWMSLEGHVALCDCEDCERMRDESLAKARIDQGDRRFPLT